jgi:hypothetical protein
MLTISEILFSDSDAKNTYIELYNTGTTDINLKSTTIQYFDPSTSTVVSNDVLQPNGSDSIIHAHEYAIIFNHSYIVKSGVYFGRISGSTLIMKTTADLFMGGEFATATNKTIRIVRSTTSAILDAYTPSIDTLVKGSSIEKINLTKDNSATNWKTSRYYRGTPGRINSVTPKNVDAMLASFSLSPVIVFKGSTAKLKIGLRNNGSTTLNNTSLLIYKTSSRDSISSKDSIIFAVNPTAIESADTTFFETNITCNDTGVYNYIAKVSVLNDEDTWNDTLSISFHVYKQTRNYNDAVLNELMYAPSADKPEWVEIYNRCQDTINLKKWKLRDPVKQTTISSSNTYVAPNTFIVVSNDSLPAKTYPPGTKVIIASLPVMNNDGDYIALKDSFGLVIDSIAYSPHWGGNNGRSLERMHYDSPSNDSTNWGSSLNPRLCTPGFINSITPKEYDISILSFTPSAAYFSETDTVSLIVKFTNRGLKASDSLSLQLFHDLNKDSTGTSNELIFSKMLPPLAPGEADSLLIRTSNFSAGTVYFIASVTDGIDLDTSNNYRFAAATILLGGNPKNEIVLNEIMYAPPSGQPEWIELYNRSSVPINLEKFHIADDADTSSAIKNDAILNAGCYCVISRDSTILKRYDCKGLLVVTSFPTLNNDGDKVILLDSLNRVVDSLAYSPAWGESNGCSIERISFDGLSTDSLNWHSTKSKYHATPGYINSATPKTADISITSLSASPAYPIKGESITPFATIFNNGTSTSAGIKVTFSYRDEKGNYALLMDTVVSMILPKDSVVVKSSHATAAINDSLNMYVQAALANDEDTSNNYLDAVIKSGNKSGTVVINEIMFNPTAGNSEWIELFNTTKDTVRLLGWRISDILTSPTEDTIKSSTVFIPPLEYLVMSRDTLPVQGIENRKHAICKYGTLNNSADGIVIKDSRGFVIDSVFYNSDWNTHAGKSLERISAGAASNDSLNWLFSYNPLGGTPGKQNSVNSIQSGSPGTLAINEIMYEPGSSNAEFVELYNTSGDSVLLNAWKLTSANKNNYFITDSVVTLPPRTYFVVCSDSVVLVKYPSLQKYIYKCILQSGSLGLLNSNSSIVLKDAYKKVVDSVYYRSAWHNPNFTNTKDRSLERINPLISSNDSRNWSSSANKNGATPGEVNSIFIGSVSSSSQLSISPNPFSPDNDGYEDFTSISFQTPFPITQVSIKIFDDKGRLMRELTNNETFGSSGTIIYDGRDKNGNPLRLGMYIVLFEAVNPQTGAKQVHKKVLVSARKL